jgi:hypothetical protein
MIFFSPLFLFFLSPTTQ